MAPSRRTGPVVLGAVLAAALAVGAAGCGGGGDDDKAASSRPTASSSSTPTPTPSDPLSAGPFGTPSPRAGLATDFPVAEVPLLDGDVSTLFSGNGSGEEGRKGWVLEVKVTQNAQACFAAAAARLVGEGYTKQGQIKAGDTVQAQFTKPGYAVIISAKADGKAGCTLGYEVGQIAK
ncbi:MAG: hypothetical protein ACJ72D_25985 [Marmoricola sp.]